MSVRLAPNKAAVTISGAVIAFFFLSASLVLGKAFAENPTNDTRQRLLFHEESLLSAALDKGPDQ